MCANCPHSALPPVGSTTNSMPKCTGQPLDPHPKVRNGDARELAHFPSFLLSVSWIFFPGRVFFLAARAIFFALTSGALGRVISSTPWSKLASILSAFTVDGMAIDRE